TKPATRELVEEAPLAPDVARRLAQRARVRDAGLREALPHLPVVLADVVDRGARGAHTPGRRGQRTLPDRGDAPRHGTLSQHWFRCASRKCRTRASSYAVSSSIQFQAVSTIAPGAILSYGRMSSFTSPYLSLGYVVRSACSAVSASAGMLLYDATTPPCSRLCTARSSGTTSLWNPHVVGAGQCGPDVGGYDGYAIGAPSVMWSPTPLPGPV